MVPVKGLTENKTFHNTDSMSGMSSSSILASGTPGRKAKIDAFQKLIAQNVEEGILEVVLPNKPETGGVINRRKRKVQSSLDATIWQMFSKIPQKEDEVYCTKCGMQFETQTGSLETLKDHLKQNHLDLWMEIISNPRLVNDNQQQSFEPTDMAENGGMSSSGSYPVNQDESSNHNQQSSRFFETGQEEQPVRQRIKRSFVWDYYDDGPVREGSNTALCKLCGQQIKWRPHSTSSLGRHLKFRHPDYSLRDLTNSYDEMSTVTINEEDDIPVWDPPEEYLEHSISVGNFTPSRPLTEGEASLIEEDPESLPSSEATQSGSMSNWNRLPALRPAARTSIYWEYFFDGLKNDGGGNVAICNECHAEISWRNGSTTGMERHLKRRHPHLWREACALRVDGRKKDDPKEPFLLSNNPEGSQPAPDSTASAQVKVEPYDESEYPYPASLPSNDGHLRIKSVLQSKVNSVKDREKFQPQDSSQLALDLAICELVVSTGLPISWLETKGFEKFIAHTCPRATLKPPETIIGERLPILFDATKDKVKKILLDEVANGKTKMIGVSTSTWISPSNVKFLSVICQYVSPDWKNRRILLESQENSEDSPPLNIVLKDFLPTENNFQVMKFSLIPDMSTRSSFYESADVDLKIEQIIPVNGAIEAAFQHSLMKNDHLMKAIDAANSFVEMVSHPSVFFKAFEAECSSLEIKQNKLERSRQSINSHIVMISSILEIQKLIETINDENYTGQLRTLKQKVPSTNQIKGLENLLPVLKRIKSVLNKLSSEKNPTSPLVIPLLMILEAYLRSVQFEESGSVKKFAELFVEELNNQLANNGKQEKAFRMGCFLHPVYRGFPLEDPDGETNDFENAKRDIIESHPSTARWQAEIDAAKANLQQSIEPKTSEVDPSSGNNDILPNIFLKRMKASNVIQDQTSPIEAEIQGFLSLPNRPEAVDDIDILEWWKNNKETFPKLAEVAKEVFSIPATSISGESIYSSVEKMSQDVDQNSNTLNMIAFIQNNIKNA